MTTTPTMTALRRQRPDFLRAPRVLASSTVPGQIAARVVLAPVAQAANGKPPTEWVIGPHKRVAFITLEGQTSSKHFVSVVNELPAASARASFFTAGSWVA